jgi:hypothetical protein
MKKFMFFCLPMQLYGYCFKDAVTYGKMTLTVTMINIGLVVDAFKRVIVELSTQVMTPLPFPKAETLKTTCGDPG